MGMIRLLGAAGSCLFLASSALAAQAADPQAILAAADRWKQPFPGPTEMQITVSNYRDAEQGDQTDYEVESDDHGQSLIQVKSGAGAGQKILTNENGTWFYAPRTRRAIRITPLQQLNGDVMVGDVASLDWRKDYDAAFDNTQETVKFEGADAIVLRLKARSEQATYREIRLYVTSDNFRPILAQHFVASGKLYTETRFSAPENLEGHLVIRRERFTRALQPQQTTELLVNHLEPAHVESGAFSLQALESKR